MVLCGGKTTSQSAYAIYLLTDDGSGKGVERITVKADKVGIGTTSPAYKLQVGNGGDGSEARANAWNLLSDARLKRDFTGLSDPLDMVEKINGYYFNWNTGLDNKRQVGFSAQEVIKVLPEVVSEGEDGYLSIEYGKMVPLLVESIKEQQKQIKNQQEQIDELKQLVKSLMQK